MAALACARRPDYTASANTKVKEGTTLQKTKKASSVSEKESSARDTEVSASLESAEEFAIVA